MSIDSRSKTFVFPHSLILHEHIICVLLSALPWENFFTSGPKWFQSIYWLRYVSLLLTQIQDFKGNQIESCVERFVLRAPQTSFRCQKEGNFVVCYSKYNKWQSCRFDKTWGMMNRTNSRKQMSMKREEVILL